MRKFSVQEGYITKMYLQINKNKNVFLIMSRHKINLGKSKVNKKLFCSARNNWFKKTTTSIEQILVLSSYNYMHLIAGGISPLGALNDLYV